MKSTEEKGSLFTGSAFIIYDRADAAKKVISMSKNASICAKVNQMTFERAPEPTDVYWEHLDVPDSRRVINTLITYSISLALVGACFGIIYGLTITKLKYMENHKNSTSSVDSIATNLLSVAISAVITIIN